MKIESNSNKLISKMISTVSSINSESFIEFEPGYYIGLAIFYEYTQLTFDNLNERTEITLKDTLDKNR